MIKIIRCSLASLALAMALVSSGTAVAADIKAGEKVFKKCKACHYADREKHKTGPHLVNIIGRTAGSLEDYKKYSKAMKASGIVWDETTLADYLRAPKKYIKGTKMAFVGLKKDADIENVIAYLMAEK
ncbi:MAG: cytochrome c family protein [Pseudomonadota bacterium]|nr:cytochrome c family protein [Pseudomonadota bacterium]MEC7496413.1 cytochrome c family protein [Pseudomonadota bacterium]MEC8131162.1 cytochrome c family protein [Pseudomonadota bacterium]MEC8262967.1 cytochrome c family protein [Pseudomonadota bacterium]